VGLAPYTLVVMQNSNQQVNVRCGILYELDLDRSTFGFSLDEIPNAGWELLPFSFVADWFLNLGSWVSAVSPKIGVRKLGEWTVVRKNSFTHTQSYFTSAGAGRILTGSGECNEFLNTRTTTRTPVIETGIRFQTNPYPISGTTLGLKRLADSLTLLYQLWHKH
jgi:hypothetical protein